MAKEKDKKDEIEELEGGDTTSDALGFTDIAAKAKAAKEDETHLDETLPSDETEQTLDPTDWSPDQEGADISEYTGKKEEMLSLEEEEAEEIEEEEIEEEEVEEKVEKVEKEEEVKKEEPSEEEKEEDKAVQELLQHLEGKTTIKVKGVERDIKDLTPEEIRVRLQKGDRFYQEMDSLAAQRKEIEKDRERTNREAEHVQRLMDTYGTSQRQQPKAQLPTVLQPHEDDTENERGLKSHIASLIQQVQNMQNTQVVARQNTESNQMINEVNALEEDYSLASKEEVLAMKAVRPDITTRELMEVSHNHYASDEFEEKYFKARPERLREIQEAAQEKFLANKQKTEKKAIARRRGSSTTSSKVHSAKKKIPRTFDEIEAMLPQLKKEYAEQYGEEE